MCAQAVFLSYRFRALLSAAAPLLLSFLIYKIITACSLGAQARMILNFNCMQWKVYRIGSQLQFTCICVCNRKSMSNWCNCARVQMKVILFFFCQCAIQIPYTRLIEIEFLLIFIFFKISWKFVFDIFIGNLFLVRFVVMLSFCFYARALCTIV